MAGEGSAGEDQSKALVGVRNVRDDAINHRVSASDKGLLNQADAQIVEDPHAVVLVRGDDVDSVHVSFRVLGLFLFEEGYWPVSWSLLNLGMLLFGIDETILLVRIVLEHKRSRNDQVMRRLRSADNERPG
jgi:hypothetical protein